MDAIKFADTDHRLPGQMDVEPRLLQETDALPFTIARGLNGNWDLVISAGATVNLSAPSLNRFSSRSMGSP